MSIKFLALVLLLAAWGVRAEGDLPFTVEPITQFDEPWALAILPDSRAAAALREKARAAQTRAKRTITIE